MFSRVFTTVQRGTRPTSKALARRNFGSSGGFNPHAPDVPWQKHTGVVMGAVMWFWVFYRGYHDGGKLLGISPQPWEEHGPYRDDEFVCPEKWK
mmetsp:Transcript_10208/g.14846  ORF Transcript_10208/g.14846 Transcript_10208/m.14846 type:complete len:94 (-) Transcript_10208:160-441(-)